MTATRSSKRFTERVSVWPKSSAVISLQSLRTLGSDKRLRGDPFGKVHRPTRRCTRAGRVARPEALRRARVPLCRRQAMRCVCHCLPACLNRHMPCQGRAIPLAAWRHAGKQCRGRRGDCVVWMLSPRVTLLLRSAAKQWHTSAATTRRSWAPVRSGRAHDRVHLVS